MEVETKPETRPPSASAAGDALRWDLAIALRRHADQRDDFMRATLILLGAALMIFVGTRDLTVMTALHAAAFVASVAGIGVVLATWFQQRPQTNERLRILIDDGYAAYQGHIESSNAPSGVFSDRAACWLLFTGAAIEFMVLFFWSGAASAAH